MNEQTFTGDMYCARCGKKLGFSHIITMDRESICHECADKKDYKYCPHCGKEI